MVETISSVVSRSPPSGGPSQVRDQQSVGGSTFVLDQRPCVVDEFTSGSVGSDLHFVRGRQLIHLDDGMGPIEQAVGVTMWNTQHRADNPYREGLGVVGQQVETSAVPGIYPVTLGKVR